MIAKIIGQQCVLSAIQFTFNSEKIASHFNGATLKQIGPCSSLAFIISAYHYFPAVFTPYKTIILDYLQNGNYLERQKNIVPLAVTSQGMLRYLNPEFKVLFLRLVCSFVRISIYKLSL